LLNHKQARFLLALYLENGIVPLIDDRTTFLTQLSLQFVAQLDSTNFEEMTLSEYEITSQT
jgi:hypothetical protein